MHTIMGHVSIHSPWYNCQISPVLRYMYMESSVKWVWLKYKASSLFKVLLGKIWPIFDWKWVLSSDPHDTQENPWI